MPGTPRDIPYLEDKFQSGDIPTQQDFYDLFASFVHYLKVKQEGGTSTTDVMSQKAVTDLVNPLFANQAANRFYCGPVSGAASAPGFRAIVAADVPFVYKNDGNAFGANVVLGLTDNFNLTLKTNNADRIFLRNDGHIAFNGAADGNFNYTFNNPFLGIKSNSGGQIYFNDSDAGVDAKNWVIVADTSGFLVRTLNDAYNTVSTPLYLTRTTSGGVGIFLGGSAPSARLHVRGAGTTTGELFKLEDGTGVPRFKVLDNGDATFGNTSYSFLANGELRIGSGNNNLGLFPTNDGTTVALSGRGVTFNSSPGTLAGFQLYINAPSSFSAPSGASGAIKITSSVIAGSGTMSYAGILLKPDYQYSGTFVGTAVGFDYSPILSSITGLSHYAARWMADNAFIQYGTDANRTLMTLSPSAATRGVLWSGTSGYSDYWMHFSSGNSTHTSGSRTTFKITQSNFQPDGAGSPVQKILELIGSVKQLNGSTATIIGIDYIPGSVNATTHLAWRNTAGNFLIGGSNAVSTIRVDVKGIGSGTILRLIDDNEVDRFRVYNSGQIVAGTTTITAGTFNAFTFSSSLTSSSTATLTQILVNPAYNTSGGFGGTAIGVDYNPTLTNTVGLTHYAALFRSGKFVVGDGTSTAKFKVKGDGTSTGELLRLDDSTGTNRFLILDNGIGTASNSWTITGANNGWNTSGAVTTTNAYSFNILGGFNASSGFFGGFIVNNTSSSSGGTSISFHNAAAFTTTVNHTGFFHNVLNPGNISGTHLAFHSTSGQVFFANTSANNVTASTRLDVRGVAAGNIFRAASDSNSLVFVIKNDGLIGVGNITPVALLDVDASTSARAGLRVRPGAAPTGGGLVDGTVWIDDTAHTMHVRINGVTKTFTLT